MIYEFHSCTERNSHLHSDILFVVIRFTTLCQTTCLLESFPNSRYDLYHTLPTFCFYMNVCTSLHVLHLEHVLESRVVMRIIMTHYTPCQCRGSVHFILVCYLSHPRVIFLHFFSLASSHSFLQTKFLHWRIYTVRIYVIFLENFLVHSLLSVSARHVFLSHF